MLQTVLAPTDRRATSLVRLNATDCDPVRRVAARLAETLRAMHAARFVGARCPARPHKNISRATCPPRLLAERPIRLPDNNNTIDARDKAAHDSRHPAQPTPDGPRPTFRRSTAEPSWGSNHPSLFAERPITRRQGPQAARPLNTNMSPAGARLATPLSLSRSIQLQRRAGSRSPHPARRRRGARRRHLVLLQRRTSSLSPK